MVSQLASVDQEGVREVGLHNDVVDIWKLSLPVWQLVIVVHHDDAIALSAIRGFQDESLVRVRCLGLCVRVFVV